MAILFSSFGFVLFLALIAFLEIMYKKFKK